uniref:Uncharacterized protein n=1 Tax=Leptobrachium leishanense TaxID=445787 RepID=A0A8C5M284_9ANUR
MECPRSNRPRTSHNVQRSPNTQTADVRFELTFESNTRPIPSHAASCTTLHGHSIELHFLLFVGVNFTGDWEVGLVNATTTYKSFSNSVVEADIGLNVGLQRINITLKGNPVHQINQTINYNEQFLWNFGEDANDYYNEGLKSGLPNPILYISEKFFQHNPCALYTQYRLYGHYASACMWVAFCSWIICNILFSMSVFIYGAYMILVTASFFIFSLLSFYTIKYVPLCDIKFGAESMTPTTEDHFVHLKNPKIFRFGSENISDLTFSDLKIFGNSSHLNDPHTTHVMIEQPTEKSTIKSSNPLFPCGCLSLAL